VSAALLAALLLRTPFRVDVVRDRGTLARIVEDGWVENVYRLQVMNATETSQRYTVAVAGLVGAQLADKAELMLAPAEARWVAVAVRMPPEAAAQQGAGSHPLVFQVRRQPASAADAPVEVQEKSTFMVPR
jgi:polyferredoxin